MSKEKMIGKRKGKGGQNAGTSTSRRSIVSRRLRTRAQVKAWIPTLSDEMLRDVLDYVYADGVRRGFGTYWHE
jgi:hypothetical protein